MNNDTEASCHISAASEEALRMLLGRSIHTIYSPNLDVGGGLAAGWKFAILLGKDEFLNLEFEWSETPHFLLDSWKIAATLSAKPIGVQVRDDGALVAPCTIKLYGATPIRRVEVIHFKDSATGGGVFESTSFDGALVFHCDGGRRFAIGCMLNGPGLATYLQFSETEDGIARLLEQGTMRLVLTNEWTSPSRDEPSATN